MRKEILLEQEEQELLPQRLARHVDVLAREIGERHLFKPEALQKAKDYLVTTWIIQGYKVYEYPYQAYGQEWLNLEVVKMGISQPKEIILVGAHYDSVFGSPGANDNASGMAVLLEISRHFSLRQTKRTVKFVTFVNEEPPFFKTSEMGSIVYAKMARKRGDNIKAMIALETIGYYNEKKGSQRHPPFFRFFYPNKGNFLGFISDFGSRLLVKKARDAFRVHSDFPLETLSIFPLVPGVDWSDHSSFTKHGYKAFMVTDTAPYRYPFYHTREDTPEKINYDHLTKVTEGLVAVVRELADTKEL